MHDYNIFTDNINLSDNHSFPWQLWKISILTFFIALQYFHKLKVIHRMHSLTKNSGWW